MHAISFKSKMFNPFSCWEFLWKIIDYMNNNNYIIKYATKVYKIYHNEILQIHNPIDFKMFRRYLDL